MFIRTCAYITVCTCIMCVGVCVVGGCVCVCACDCVQACMYACLCAGVYSCKQIFMYYDDFLLRHGQL